MSTETVPAPAGQGAIREHTGSMWRNRNTVRRDAGTVECRDDFFHGLLRAWAIHTLRKIFRRYIHQQTNQNVSPTITDSRAGSLAAPQSWKMFSPRCVRKVAAVQPGRSMLIE